MEFKNDEGKKYILKDMIPKEEIKIKNKIIAKKIEENFSFVHFIALLKGSFVFASDLIREIQTSCTIDFMSVSSYIGSESSGEVKILKELNEPIHDKDVIILEDIIDTGLTLFKTLEVLKTRNPNSITICSLLDKPEKRVINIEADIVGFKIPDEFVVGYGIDYEQRHRDLGNICSISFL